VNQKLQDIQDALVAVNGLLGWGFISPATRTALEVLKVDLRAELRFLLDQHSDVANAS
jgi:hypothetical protein